MNDFDSSAPNTGSSGSAPSGSGLPGSGPSGSGTPGLGSDANGPAAPSAGSAATPLPPRHSFGRRHWGKLTLLLLLGIPLAGFALWIVIGLNWSYSNGTRSGTVQKISSKGWLCKTWEGTLYTSVSPGFRADSFNFTVRNDSLAHVIEGLSGKRVAVRYDQHTLVPISCFGDTEYFVSGVDVLPN
jgi:hypothetical protein